MVIIGLVILFCAIEFILYKILGYDEVTSKYIITQLFVNLAIFGVMFWKELILYSIVWYLLTHLATLLLYVEHDDRFDESF